jgi:hypothetical protein
MTRVVAIQKSQSGLVSGIIGCIPVLGLGSAIYAMICWTKVRRQYRDWNPAGHYLNIGAALGLLGLLVSVAVAGIVGCAIIDAYTQYEQAPPRIDGGASFAANGQRHNGIRFSIVKKPPPQNRVPSGCD